MFEIEEHDGHASIYLVGIGEAGCKSLHEFRAAGMPRVARYVAIAPEPAAFSQRRLQVVSPAANDESDAATCTVLDDGQPPGDDTKLTTAPSGGLPLQVQEALRGADIILVAADMKTPRDRSLASLIAPLARAEASVIFGVAVLSPETTRGEAPTDAQVSGFIASVRAGITVPGTMPQRATEAEIIPEHVNDLPTKVLLEVYTCIARGLVHPLMWGSVFQDIRTALRDGGNCFIGWGAASGENSARRAAQSAITHPMLGVGRLAAGQNALVTLRGNRGRLTKIDMRDVAETLRNAAGNELWIVLSAVYDDSLTDSLHVSVLAVGGSPSADSYP